MGGFQMVGAPAACNPSGGKLIMTGSTVNTISHALQSNPNTSCTGTLKWPDIRQFDEAVYEADSSRGAPPSSITAFSASPQTITLGQSSTLNWRVINATDVVITGLGDV